MYTSNFRSHKVWQGQIKIRNLILIFLTIVFWLWTLTVLADLEIQTDIQNAKQTIQQIVITSDGTDAWEIYLDLNHNWSWSIYINPLSLTENIAFSGKILWLDESWNVVYIYSSWLNTNWGWGWNWDSVRSVSWNNIYRLTGNLSIWTDINSWKFYIVNSWSAELVLQETANLWAANIYLTNPFRTRAIGWDSNPDVFYIWLQWQPIFFSITASWFVGIWTNWPTAKLEIKGWSFLVQWNTWSTPFTWAGRRIMWVPDKWAFRAWNVNWNYRDSAYIWQYSVALWYDNMAKWYSSMALGNNAVAAHTWSFVRWDGRSTNWETVGWTYLSNYWWYTNLKFDSDWNIIISYGCNIRERNGSNWNNIWSSEDFCNITVWSVWSWIDIDSSNNIYSSFTNYESGAKISVKKRNWSSRSYVGGTLSSMTWEDNVIKIKNNGYPVVAYADDDSPVNTTVKERNWSSRNQLWSSEYCLKPSLAIDNNEDILLFCWMSSSTYQWIIKKRNWSSRSSVGSLSTSAINCSTDSKCTSIAVDNNNYIYISYLIYDWGYTIESKYRDWSSWTSLDNIWSILNSSDLSVKIDSSDNQPYISYVDNTRKIKLKKRNWSSRTNIDVPYTDTVTYVDSIIYNWIPYVWFSQYNNPSVEKETVIAWWTANATSTQPYQFLIKAYNWVWINTFNPRGTLDVNGNIFILNNRIGSNTNQLYFESGGNIGIWTSSPSEALDVNWNINVNWAIKLENDTTSTCSVTNYWQIKYSWSNFYGCSNLWRTSF